MARKYNLSRTTVYNYLEKVFEGSLQVAE
ncbi:hypothetical protein [Amphibacillus sediminis]|nr:hypothetical protein [Amphibacillus sediminis]